MNVTLSNLPPRPLSLDVVMHMISLPFPLLAWFAVMQLGFIFIDQEILSKYLVTCTSIATLLVAFVRVVSDYLKDKRHLRKITELEEELTVLRRQSEQNKAQLLNEQTKNDQLSKMLTAFTEERADFRQEIRALVNKEK